MPRSAVLTTKIAVTPLSSSHRTRVPLTWLEMEKLKSQPLGAQQIPPTQT